jgi:hypothetical protein
MGVGVVTVSVVTVGVVMRAAVLAMAGIHSSTIAGNVHRGVVADAISSLLRCCAAVRVPADDGF